MNAWLREIWQSWRAMLRRPGFLLLASGVLALGTGASVAVVTLIENTLWRPLPVPQAERLVMLGAINDNGEVGGISPQEYQSIGALDGVASLGLVRPKASVNVAGARPSEQVPAIYIDRQLLPTLGLQPLLGRNFDASEDRPNGRPAIILGYGYWLRGYGGDTGIIGRTMQVEGTMRTIVGVLPPAFNTVQGPGDVILPMALPTASQDDSRNGELAIARLLDGANSASVSAQIDAHERTAFRYAGADRNGSRTLFRAEPLASAMEQNARPVLALFLASALLVSIIAVVNLTNLMLLRALRRTHDTAVRCALGASLPRLMLPAVGEGLLIGACGAFLGMALAASGLALVQGFIPREWLWGGHIGIGAIDWIVAFAASLFGALLSAALALWRSRDTSTVSELRDGGRNGIGVRSGRLGRVLVVAQVALAAVLLCVAGVFMHAIYDASRLPLGFTSEGILTFELAPVKVAYPDAASVQALSQSLLDRLRAIPGITDATVATNLPTSEGLAGQFQANLHVTEGLDLLAQYHGVEPGFFRLFAIPLREGRDFSRDDTRAGDQVAIISQDLADNYFGHHALGKTIELKTKDASFRMRVIGVVGATYQRGVLQPRQPVLYVPLAQMPEKAMAVFRSIEPLRFALRGHGNPLDWQASVRQVVAEAAADQPIAALRTMQSTLRQTTRNAQLSLLLIDLFAALALLLAAAGLYTVMAVAVAAREREFGVRIALGAEPSRLLRLVLRGGLLQILAGLAVGSCAALLVIHALSTLLSAVIGRGSRFDAVAFGWANPLLALAGLLACLQPAARAARVQPMQAIRGD